MTRFIKSSVFVISILSCVAVILVAGCSSRFVPPGEETDYPSLPPSSSFDGPTNGLVQSNTGGNVDIDVEWVVADSDSLVFNVAMNTHSVDLDQYDLGELAVLRDDRGNEYRAISWESASGGHHRTGILTFPILPDSLSQGKAGYLEIVIRDVAGIEERVLKWEL